MIYKKNLNFSIFKTDAFVNVIKKDLKVRIKINDKLDRYERLRYNYQSKTGYDCLI